MEEKLESWRYALERRGMKVNRRKTDECERETGQRHRENARRRGGES